MKKEAASLINSFAEQLLALNDGKAIPQEWKHHLLKALDPPPKTRGVKADPERIAAIAKEITLKREILLGERTEKTEGQRGESKKALARKHGVSERKVERVKANVSAYLVGRKLPPDLNRAVVNGISAAVGEEVFKELDAEAEEKNRAALKWMRGCDK